MEVKDASKICRIHINPLSGSENIKQWRKQCETLLDSFLQKFNSISLSVQTGLSKQMGLPIVKPKPSISVELQTVLHITGNKKEVSEAVQTIENSVRETMKHYESEKRKPCIVPC